MNNDPVLTVLDESIASDVDDMRKILSKITTSACDLSDQASIVLISLGIADMGFKCAQLSQKLSTYIRAANNMLGDE